MEAGVADRKFEEILLQLEKLRRGFIEISENFFESVI
jgi:hypothetical protein